MRLAAEIEYSEESSYAATGSRPDYAAASAAVNTAGGAVIANFNASLYCVKSTLPGGGNWCVDSAGFIGDKNCVVNAFNCQ